MLGPSVIEGLSKLSPEELREAFANFLPKEATAAEKTSAIEAWLRSPAGGALREAMAGLLALAGCHVDEHKNGDGDNVKIETPFGGLQVKTNDAAVRPDIGLPAYPGAQPKKKKDKDGGSADVDLNFGNFHLGVKAASYLTPDSQDKVEAFYRGALKRYGAVIACRDGSAVGKPVRTFEGLTCDAHEGNHVQVNDHPSKNSLELKTGSERRQRIVEIEPDGGGTKFSLVALEVPGKSSSGEENDDTRQ